MVTQDLILQLVGILLPFSTELSFPHTLAVGYLLSFTRGWGNLSYSGSQMGRVQYFYPAREATMGSLYLCLLSMSYLESSQFLCRVIDSYWQVSWSLKGLQGGGCFFSGDLCRCWFFCRFLFGGSTSRGQQGIPRNSYPS